MGVGVIGMITEIKKNFPNISLILLAVFLLLSGWILAFTSHKTIIQPYKDLKNNKTPLLKLFINIILTISNKSCFSWFCLLFGCSEMLSKLFWWGDG